MMYLTKEQQAIINSKGNIKINAVAGSGKTTTVIEYAKARPASSKILYIAFNKSVKLEAAKKFKDERLSNVKVETAHSLAYKNIVYKHQYKIRHQGYKTHELAEMLNIKGTGEKHTEYVIANHINKFISYFCNSIEAKIEDLNYQEIVSDKVAKEIVRANYNTIKSKTKLLLNKMNRGEIEITHDFYLKKFQLSNPALNCDYILFDEGQDASPTILDIFLKQEATKIIVGDTHQQIYGWRNALNSLEKVDFKTYQLSTSFRFSQDIANLGMSVLKWKGILEDFVPIEILGKGESKSDQVKAVLARTNLGLLLKAIEYVVEKKNIKHIYFEGNINSYTYADDGASLYDVLHLYNGKHRLIRDKLIKEMQDIDDLEDYIAKTEDVQLALMIEIVRKYGNEIPKIIKKIKSKHVENHNKEKAEMIFSTVHRCKGMEYDAIHIVNDFITEAKIEKIQKEAKIEDRNLPKINEEINLLYVAVTRTKNSIHIPENLLPKDFPKSNQIHRMRVESDEEKAARQSAENLTASTHEDQEKAYSVEKIREKHKGAYSPWTTELDEELTMMYCEGINTKDLSKHFGRTSGAIRSRIKKLELEVHYNL